MEYEIFTMGSIKVKIIKYVKNMCTHKFIRT